MAEKAKLSVSEQSKAYEDKIAELQDEVGKARLKPQETNYIPLSAQRSVLKAGTAKARGIQIAKVLKANPVLTEAIVAAAGKDNAKK